MTVRREERNGEFRWVIDISYRTTDGKAKRYRRDAQVQLRKAAEAENRRLEDHLAKVGTLEQIDAPAAPEPVTFAEAVKHFRATHMKSALCIEPMCGGHDLRAEASRPEWQDGVQKVNENASRFRRLGWCGTAKSATR